VIIKVPIYQIDTPCVAAFPLTIVNTLCYKTPFKKEVRMTSIQRGILLALLVALGQPLFPHFLHPTYAQETADRSDRKESVQPEAAAEGNEGLATYYARRYHGRKTHSGARYHPEKLTAASPDLPMGSQVMVKNLDNGKEVLVTVNDRCRKRKTPFIDLSRAAARKLGFYGRGIAKVMISLFEGKDKTEKIAQGTVE
jgi:rare lipoprotein A